MLALRSKSRDTASGGNIIAMPISRLMDIDQKCEMKAVWLCAMLEAEGTFSFAYNEQIKDGTIHSHIQPIVIFTNSDMRLVKRVDDVLCELGFTPYRGKEFSGGMGRKPKRDLQYRGF